MFSVQVWVLLNNSLAQQVECIFDKDEVQVQVLEELLPLVYSYIKQ